VWDRESPELRWAGGRQPRPRRAASTKAVEEALLRLERPVDGVGRRPYRGGGENVKPILCAFDGSDASEEALKQADALARADGTRLCILRVLPNVLRHHPLFPNLYPDEYRALGEREAREGELVSERVAGLTGRPPEDFDVEVDTGTPYAAIVRRGEELDAAVVVVGGRRPDAVGRHVLGDTAERVVRYANGPVLVARPGSGTGRVLAATDLSDPSLPAVAAAAEWARRNGSRLAVLHVIDLRAPTVLYAFDSPLAAAEAPPGFRDKLRLWAASRIADALKGSGVDADQLVEQGVPETVILAQARSLAADLIVIGTSGQTGLARVLLGSVAEAVVRSAPCSVLVVRLRHQGESHDRNEIRESP